jgi:hypothetical protein
LFLRVGYLKDYPIERYLRDVRVHQILEGTNEIMNGEQSSETDAATRSWSQHDHSLTTCV